MTASGDPQGRLAAAEMVRSGIQILLLEKWILACRQGFTYVQASCESRATRRKPGPLAMQNLDRGKHITGMGCSLT
jgi:hypothetical protein